jgi:phosphoglycolate phosphatase
MGERRKIFFDLDGTILDSKQRLYELYSKLVKENKLTFEEYWKNKRNMKDHESLLLEFGWDKRRIDLFEKEWLSLIEDEEFLLFDKPFTGVVGILETLSKNFDLYLITARQSKSKVINQLSKYQLLSYFNDVLVTEHKADKYSLLSNSKLLPTSHDIFVGDTGIDIQLAKKFNSISVAVCSGFRCKDVLTSYHPDYIVDSVSDPDFLKVIPN